MKGDKTRHTDPSLGGFRRKDPSVQLTEGLSKSVTFLDFPLTSHPPSLIRVETEGETKPYPEVGVDTEETSRSRECVRKKVLRSKILYWDPRPETIAVKERNRDVGSLPSPKDDNNWSGEGNRRVPEGH